MLYLYYIRRCAVEQQKTKKRGGIERWLNRHNHKMELLRTGGSVIAALTGICIFLKVFGLLSALGL